MLMVTALALAMNALAVGTASAAPAAPATAAPYSCAPNGPAGNQMIYGTFGDASVIGCGPVLFQLPAFVGNIAHASAGMINETTGTVTLAPAVRTVAVQLKHPESAS